jgi:transcriptional regulator with XRE-family HTH domain
MDIQKRAAEFGRLVGLELKGRIISQGFTANDVADETGHSRAAFNRWLNGKVEIPVHVMCEACEAIDWDPSNIVETAYDRMVGIYGELTGAPADEDTVEFALGEIEQLERGDADDLPSYLLAAHRNPDRRREAEGREDSI